MPDDTVTPTPGPTWLFGKLPVHGDFVARGRHGAARDALDHWLSAEMQRARTTWADEFDARFDASPVWHFVESDADGQWQGGILCASADRVGRRFPLLLGTSASDAGTAAAASAGCLSLASRAFAEGWDADRIVAEPVEGEDLPWQPAGTCWALVGEDGPVVEIEGARPMGVIERMLEMAA